MEIEGFFAHISAKVRSPEVSLFGPDMLRVEGELMTLHIIDGERG